jgi:hypothetical protein
MKTIYQTEEIAFRATTLKSALVMLPIMDELVQTVNRNRLAEFYNQLPPEVQKQYHGVWVKRHIDLEPRDMEKILALLTEIGFASQIDFVEPSAELLESKN